jgi:NitT/TauT family transport system substrate-binding protein
MHTNRRDLLLAGCCAASTAAALERYHSAQGRRARSAARNYHDPTREGPSICIAPVYVVSDLLKEEGFANVVYVETGFVR